MPDCIYDLRYDEIKPTALLSAPRCNSASLLGLVYSLRTVGHPKKVSGSAQFGPCFLVSRAAAHHDRPVLIYFIHLLDPSTGLYI